MNKSSSLDQIQLSNGLFLEASAGTGKTYTVAALVTRELAMDDSLRIADILISTFTRNAAAELRDRVRRRIIEMADNVASAKPIAGDVLSEFLCGHSEAKRQQIASNLRRAAVEFDSATIGTIHSVCSKILVMAGLPSGNGDESSSTKLLIKQQVNNFLAGEALAPAIPGGSLPLIFDEELLEKLVEQTVMAPDAELWVDPSHPQAAHLKRLVEKIEEMVDSIHLRTQNTPTYDDLLRRAADVMSNNRFGVTVAAIRQKYRMAFVDEAQDTDPLQWRIFREIIQKISKDSYLVVVGDPKQSIYRFRGADVNAYLEQRDPKNLISLDTNFRSDEDVISALNALMAGQSFGDQIDYVNVKFAPKNKGSQLSRFSPVEIIDLGDKPTVKFLRTATAYRVAEILKHAKIEGKSVALSDVCVLVRSNEVGLNIERELRRLKIPAVSGGTASVIKSEAAQSLRYLLQALERPSDVGRVRSAIASMFFGRSLLDPGLVVDASSKDAATNGGKRKNASTGIEVEHEFIRVLARALQEDGIAAVEARILSNPLCLNAILRSERAERRLTDLRHLIELIHRETEGKGIDASIALQTLADLESLDATAELVSRRIESDQDAVKILTIHAAKGLEFPIVVIADMWKDPKLGDTATKTADERKISKPPMFLSPPVDKTGKRNRRIDVAWVVGGVPTPSARLASEAEALDEMKRQFYVAVTRAKHHVSILLPTNSSGCVAYQCINEEAFGKKDSLIPLVQVPAKVLPTVSPRPIPEVIQSFDGSTTQTYRRTSFTGIAEIAAGRGATTTYTSSGAGHDEKPDFFGGQLHSATSKVQTGVLMPLARIPKGAYIGTVLHTIFEHFDSTCESLEDEISALVDKHASSPSLVPFQKELINGLQLVVKTPLGPFMNNATLASISPRDRLHELSFEMGLAHLSRNVRVQLIGDVLLDMLPPEDVLRPYAAQLCRDNFNIPLAGLLNGSIDAVLRIKNSEGQDQLFITDYKSNRLDNEDDVRLIDAYHPRRLISAMEHHHYPLQAILYGVALHRFLRWKSPEIDTNTAIGGIAYFFLRGMVNDSSFVDESGTPFGVFQWKAPSGLWARLSDVLAGVNHA